MTLDNMGDKMIGTQRGTTGFIYCSDTPENGGFGEDHVTAYDDGALSRLWSTARWTAWSSTTPRPGVREGQPGLTILDTEFANEDYAIGVKKGNTELLDAINNALKELIEDGTVQSIIDKYIPAEAAE